MYMPICSNVCICFCNGFCFKSWVEMILFCPERKSAIVCWSTIFLVNNQMGLCIFWDRGSMGTHSLDYDSHELVLNDS